MTPQAETREIAVTDHARDQARLRFGLLIDGSALDEFIALDVRAGRRNTSKPRAFRLYNQGKQQSKLLGNQRFVTSQNGERGYVIDQYEDRDVVITAMRKVR